MAFALCRINLLFFHSQDVSQSVSSFANQKKKENTVTFLELQLLPHTFLVFYNILVLYDPESVKFSNLVLTY